MAEQWVDSRVVLMDELWAEMKEVLMVAGWAEQKADMLASRMVARWEPCLVVQSADELAETTAVWKAVSTVDQLDGM